MKQILSLFVLGAILSLAGCGRGTTQDISKKVNDANVKTKADLERVLGKPDKFAQFGPAESWTYKTSDGEYTVQVIGDKVVFGAGASK